VHRCRECGRENRAEARFCDGCGAALDAEPAAQREERKVVTVLFADLVGFTARAERMDPEDVRAMLAPYHDRLRAELERFGGTVEKFIGDAAMALFGAPAAHEDDPERAVRAALAIRDWVRDEADGLQVRIAVNTGEALIALDARPESGESMASGDVVNTASRLQSAAPVNGILVGETTHRATRHVIDYVEAEPVAAKGKTNAIPVWEAVEARSRLGVDLLREVRSPLVGRERERALLRETLVRVREEHAPQLVTLVGIPGIGKSRLVHELLGAVRESGVLTYWRQGRSLPYGDGVTYWALSEMVKAQAGILETDSSAEAERKLRVAVDELVTDRTDAEWVRSRVETLAGLSPEPREARDRQTEAFTAWRRFFEAMADRRPLVLVFEDVHWADDGLLDFVDHLVDWATDSPILVVCTARPELLERRPGWGGGKLNSTTLSLSPLSNEETARLVAALLGRPLLDAELQRRLLEHAGGNPLYAEQYTQMLAELGDDQELSVPESVQGIIAARLDLLPPEEKQLLQDASVLGKVFWLGGIVNGRPRDETEARLHALERKGFVQRARQSSVANEPEYAFRHVLVRDVAYGMLPRSARAAGHRGTAAWIETLGRSDDHAEMLAHHYTSAVELARAIGESDRDLEEQARAALEHAGDRAFALNAYSAAAGFYEQALALWPEDSRERALLLFRVGQSRYLAQEGGTDELERAAATLERLGEVETAAEAEARLYEHLMRAGQRDLADGHLLKARSLLTGSPPSRSKALVLTQIALSDMLAERSRAAIDSGREALAMAERLGLDELRAAALNFIGVAREQLGDRGGIEDIERATEIAANASAPYEVARAYNNLASVYRARGELAAHRDAQAECMRISERFGQTVWLRWYRTVEAGHAYNAGNWDDALAIVAEQLSGQLSQYQSGGALVVRALVRVARGELDDAAADARRAIDLSRLARDPQALVPTLGVASYVLFVAGSRDEALELIDEFVTHARTGVWGSMSALPSVAWTLSRLGRGAELIPILDDAPASTWVDLARSVSLGDFLEAAEICAKMELGPDEAYARMRAAEQLIAVGRRAEAEVQLRAALAFYRSVEAKSFTREAETLLAAAG
jgi:class 3 adenylate cyclase/tetratricopeptide (TPR) repeat protein